MGKVKEIAVIIVLYETSALKYKSGIDKNALKKNLFILVDNTPVGNKNKQPINSDDSIIYIDLKENTGIANALNEGIKIAQLKNCKFIFTFDQDSIVNKDLLDNLISRYQEITEKEKNTLIALGPHPKNIKTNKSYLRRKDRIRKIFSKNKNYMQTNEIITSGLLTTSNVYDEIGLYEKDLFIDFVDHEWCWRLNKHGGKCFVSLKDNLAHLVGDYDIPFTLGMKKGSAFRIYFLFRNATNLIINQKMPFFDSIKFITLIPVKIFVFSLMSDRKERIKNLFNGIADGFKR